jgi:ABC-2 type transport system ATP-binding protein
MSTKPLTQTDRRPGEHQMLSIQNLSKTYDNGVRALREVTLEIPNGMFGLLGPNGAGKSSLMRTLATLQSADSGSARLGDIDVLNQKHELRKHLGYLPQEFGVYPDISAVGMLNHLAVLKGIENSQERKTLVEYLLHMTNLWDARKRKLITYSGGMRQRFGIAQALLGEPRLVIVDEPTAGLDPEERRRFLNLLSEIGENVVVILSTHIVEDVGEICGHMAIIDQGQVRYTGAPRCTIKDLEGYIWEKVIDKSEVSFYEQSTKLISKRLFAGQIRIHVYSECSPGDGFELVKPDLEDAYFTHLYKEMTPVNA